MDDDDVALVFRDSEHEGKRYSVPNRDNTRFLVFYSNRPDVHLQIPPLDEPEEAILVDVRSYREEIESVMDFVQYMHLQRGLDGAAAEHVHDICRRLAGHINSSQQA